MNRYRFKLEKLHRLRVAAEREALSELSRTIAVVREAEQHLRSIAERHGEVVGDLQSHMGGTRLDAAVVERHHRDLERLSGYEHSGRRALREANGAYESAAQRLRVRRGERKALDMLEERARLRHQQEVQRQESLEQDELALSRHGRKVI